MANGIPINNLRVTEHTYDSVTMGSHGYSFLSVPTEITGKTIYSLQWVLWNTAGEPPTGYAIYQNDQFILYAPAGTIFTDLKIRFIDI